MNTPIKTTAVAVAVAGVLAVAGCSTSTYDERIQYLRKTAQRGAAMHDYLVAQGAHVDKGRCERAYNGSRAWQDAPYDGASTRTREWLDQIEEFYVDSCLSGKPKPVPGDPMPLPSGSPSAGSSPSPEISPSL